MSTAIKARVATSAGRGLDSAVITVMSADGAQRDLVRADVEGAVAVDDLEAGTYTVVATAAGYQPAARVAVVSGGGPISLGEIVLTRAGSAPTPAVGHWAIDAGHSTIEISVSHLGISTVRGRFTDFTGSIDVPAERERATVEAEIKTASIDTDNRMRDDTLRSAAFFDVEAHPIAGFRADGVTPAGDETWTLAGVLTLRGVAVPVTLDLTFLGETDDPWGGRRAGFRASGVLQRADFGIRFDDKLLSGVAQIGGTATVNLDIQAVRGQG